MGIVLADRCCPSRRLCSDCGPRNDQFALGERTWIRAGYGAHHDCDVDAAVDLQRLGHRRPGGAPGATRGSQAVTSGTAAGRGRESDVGHQHRQQDGTEQEEIGGHLCASYR